MKLVHCTIFPPLLRTAPADYTSLGTVALTFDSQNYQTFVIVTIVDDNVLDGTKVFYATLLTQAERVSIPNNRSMIVIMDNDSKLHYSLLFMECSCIDALVLCSGVCAV